MSLNPDALIGQAVGTFRVEELIGSGTFAWVFRARDDEGGAVALKILRPRYAGDPEFERRFRNEFQVASELSHPNVIRILNVGQEAAMTYFAMEFCEDSLASRVDREGPLPDSILLPVARQVADALTFAHGSGIIHRDIKPDNILFGATGRVVLGDFGIARAVSGFVAATGANMTIGTPHYLSPEQAQGQPLDGRSDLYSLGVTLYKASTGALPFRSTDWFELARMHVEEPPRTPRSHRADISERFERIILKLMAKQPDDRYESAEALAAELRDIQRTSRETTSFGGTAAHPRPSALRDARGTNRWLWRVAGLLLVLAVATLVIVFGSR